MTSENDEQFLSNIQNQLYDTDIAYILEKLIILIFIMAVIEEPFFSATGAVLIRVAYKPIGMHLLEHTFYLCYNKQ